jgi:phosphopantetheine adenylyltransferase
MVNEIIARIKKITETPVEDKFITFSEYMQLKESNNKIYETELIDCEEINELDIQTIAALNPAMMAQYKAPEVALENANFIVGRFQPFTNGHIKAINELHEQNTFPVIVVNIKSGKTPISENSPYDINLQNEMFEEIKKEYPHVKEMITIYGKASILQIFNEIRKLGYEPALWGVGSDRINTFGYQAERYKEQVKPSIYFKVYEIVRKNGDVSATMARNALKTNDRVTFENLVPPCIHFFYDKLKDVVMSESINANKGPLYNLIKDTIIGTNDGTGNIKLENL